MLLCLSVTLAGCILKDSARAFDFQLCLSVTLAGCIR